MSLADYIATLQKTKTYQADLISFQEYSFQSRMLGLVKALPNLPHADEDRHVVVVEIRGNQPNIRTVLKESGHTFHATAKDIDKLLFIFVEMRPHTLVIENPADGYRLGDGHRIDAKFTVTYKIEDAKKFWQGSRDQLAEFEMSVIDAAKNYFLKNSSHILIGSPADFKQSLENHIRERETDIIVLKNRLEDSICETCIVAGIKLLKVFADVNIGDSLHEYLKRIRDKIYEGGGIAERRKIDQIIDSDRTFAPYNLRAVIHALDMRLLENFYTMKWSDAMRKVTERLAEKKEEYMISVEQKELMRMRELINAAGSLGLDEMDVTDLKSKIASKLISMANKDTNSHTFSDAEYLKAIISPSSDRLLESNSKTPELIN